jgi:Uma2 family endonuclease
MSIGTRPARVIPREEVPLDRFYRLSVDQYRRMAEVGILTARDGVELLEGVIYVKHPASFETSERFYRLGLDQYHAMIDAGILTADDAVELLDGWLIRTMPIKPPHRRATERAFAALVRIIPAGWYATMQQPITTGDSEPQPDVSVVRGTTDDYPDRHPGPADLGLIVEVSHSSLADDRGFKRAIYARAEVRIYWIVNLVDRQVEVHTEPSGPGDSPGYARREVFGPDAEVPVILDGREVGRVAVRDVLP